MSGRRIDCCDLHNTRCEPPGELCCAGCTEAAHPLHRDDSPCVLTVWPPADRALIARADIRRRYGLSAAEVNDYLARGERRHLAALVTECGIADPRAHFGEPWWCGLEPGHDGDHDRRALSQRLLDKLRQPPWSGR